MKCIYKSPKTEARRINIATFLNDRLFCFLSLSYSGSFFENYLAYNAAIRTRAHLMRAKKLNLKKFPVNFNSLDSLFLGSNSSKLLSSSCSLNNLPWWSSSCSSVEKRFLNSLVHYSSFFSYRSNYLRSRSRSSFGLMTSSGYHQDPKDFSFYL